LNEAADSIPRKLAKATIAYDNSVPAWLIKPFFPGAPVVFDP